MPVTNFVWDPLNDSYLMEMDATGMPTMVYTQESASFGGLVSQRNNGATTWYHCDDIGNARILTNHTQLVLNTYIYDAWGNIIYDIGFAASFLWGGRNGYYSDPDTGQFYVRVRVYQPATATWLSNDPLESTSLTNRYKYVFGSPIRFSDPSGMDTKTEVVSINPTGGNSYPVGADPSTVKLGIAIVSPELPMISIGLCGLYHWSITWFKPKPNPHPNGSYVMQQIIKTWRITDCCGRDITVEKMAEVEIPRGNYNNGRTWVFYEAWYFHNADQYTDTYRGVDDTFGDPGFGLNTIGEIHTRGRYTEVAGSVPTPPFARGGVVVAGAAYATVATPSITPMGPYRQHNIVVKWDCCHLDN